LTNSVYSTWQIYEVKKLCHSRRWRPSRG